MMAKMNKTKEYAAKYLSEVKKMTAENIANELNIGLEDVNNLLEQAKSDTKHKAKTSRTQDLMIRQTSVKKTNNVSIMTEGASQYNDAMRDKVQKKISRKDKNAIFKPRND